MTKPPVPNRPPEPSRPPPLVVVVDVLGAGSSETSVVVELFALGCPAGPIVEVTVELGCSTMVEVMLSVEVALSLEVVLSLEVGLSSEPRSKRPGFVVVVDLVEVAEVDDVEFVAPLLVPEVSAGTLAGPVVDVVNCEGGFVCASAAVLSCVLDVLSVEG